MLCFFVLLGYGILGGTFKGPDAVPVYQMAPWIIPPSLVAATFMWLSTDPKNLRLDRSEALRYVAWHMGAALVGSLIAYFLWKAAGGSPRPKDMNNLPAELSIYLVIITASCIGGMIGWVLSGTNRPSSARLGNLIRKS
jgi:hypothetical protein